MKGLHWNGRDGPLRLALPTDRYGVARPGHRSTRVIGQTVRRSSREMTGRVGGMTGHGGRMTNRFRRANESRQPTGNRR